MRAVVQRVKEARVTVEGKTVGEIQTGLLVFLGVGQDDEKKDLDYLAAKISGLRIFENESGHFDKSITDIGGSMLVISQFTLYGDCRKGRRPSFTAAGDPKIAEKLYDQFVEKISGMTIDVATGSFGAMMDVTSVNWGPVTMLIDSRKVF